MRDSQVEILERHTAYQGFFRLEVLRLRHRLFAGGWSEVITRELFERGHAVAVLPYDPILDQVVLIEQFRVGALDAPGGSWLLEIVAGMAEGDEPIADVAARETAEEAGCTVSVLEPICRFLVSPGGTSERIHVFCGRVDARGVGGVHGIAAEHEDIRVLSMPASTAFDYVAQGRIDSAAPIIALQWLQLHREDLRTRWEDKK